MSGITNTTSFRELQPIPIDKDPWPRFKKGFNIVCFVSSITVFTSGIGFSFGLAEIGFSAVVWGIAGIVAGLVIGIALSFFLKFSTPLEKYRIKTLEQMEPLQTHPRAMDAIKKLKNVFENNLYFVQPFEIHDLYGNLATITETIPPYRPDVKKIWNVFLDNLPKCSVKVRGKKEISLDPTIEKERMENPQALQNSLKTSVLDKKSPRVLQDLEEVEQLQHLSLSVGTVFPKQKMYELLLQADCNKCVLVKQDKSGKILGFAWTYKQEAGEFEIIGLARHPTAAHLNIGESLLKELIPLLPEKSLVQLHVRKENSVAISLYKRFGFEIKKEEKNYYGSGENAFVMSLNWAIFEALHKHAA